MGAPSRWLLVASALAAVSRGQDCAGASCAARTPAAGGDGVGLLQTPRGRGEALAAAGGRARRRAGRAEARARALDAAFAGVTGRGRYFNPDSRTAYIDKAFEGVDGAPGSHPAGAAKQDSTWEMCTEVNWTSVVLERDTTSVQDMLKELHMDLCYDSNSTLSTDATCVAVRAALEATLAMPAQFPEGPQFANYSVVSWGKYPSWVIGAVSGLDYTGAMPTQASLVDPNGVAGYGACDVLRTVLTQSADQMQTGTCSWVASLAALSHKAPAITIKLGMELLWAGRIGGSNLTGCRNIYHQQPGLIPFPTSGDKWVPDFYSSSLTTGCGGNAADCNMGAGKPAQNAGLTFMWSQTLESSWMTKNYGSCLREGVRAGLKYPGMGAADEFKVELNQGGWFNSMLWSCEMVMDPQGGSCKLLLNTNMCQFMPEDLCLRKIAHEPAQEVVMEVWQPLLTKYKSEAFQEGHVTPETRDAYALPKLRAEVAHFPVLSKYIDDLVEIGAAVGKPPLEVERVGGDNFKWPSFTEELLNQTCAAYTNILALDSRVLQAFMMEPSHMEALKEKRLPFYGNVPEALSVLGTKSRGCNHAVYLQECDYKKNEYTIWSWGSTYTLTREMLLGYPTDQPLAPPTNNMYTWNTGVVCAAITADQLTIS